MRAPRLVILVIFLSASLFLFCRAFAVASRSASAQYPAATKTHKTVWGMMYYNTPFSLFPPNAAISLTDDNSTSFAARPAAFGPKLVSNGLSGQLWVGSGFPEDSLDSDGELGCSDLPGWDSGNTRAALKNSFKSSTPRLSAPTSESDHHKRATDLLDREHRDAISKTRPDHLPDDLDDGTDNYLTQEVSGTLGRHDSSTSSSHADIQSLQEAAEIEGKVVLLKRGGCGFLEKVMWAQRRGAVAVIVGDNMRGGPLIQMFAHGEEVENVTIPSVFTARTTAHLLSSLTQPGSFIEDSLDDGGNPVLKVQQGVKSSASSTKGSSSTKSAASPKTTLASSSDKSSTKDSSGSSPGGWVSRVFRWRQSSPPVDQESRPPTSGQLDWVLVEDWSVEKDEITRESIGKPKTKASSSEDDFRIGVQDWRDPDFVDKSGTSSARKSVSGMGSAGESTRKTTDHSGPKGGSITPGSGEYSPERTTFRADGLTGTSESTAGLDLTSKSRGIISRIFGSSSAGTGDPAPDTRATYQASPSSHGFTRTTHKPHEGLWVTITPTSSASPLFDTLLVLVISPLVTLTVVYALLILRARIRRRRWRAPKSVVEQLPVRTYHTVASTPSSVSLRGTSPSAATATTPLLQHSPTRPRPRSRTTTGIPDSESLSGSVIASSSPLSRVGSRGEHEKLPGSPSTEWKKYMGRQVECVVCLEEYVDGVSKVMSLPCGHEFHVECITPWLTTRRRTCPICKGDVVRSMARASSSNPRYEPFQDDSGDEEEEDDDDDSSLDEADSAPARTHAGDPLSDLEEGVHNTSEERRPRRSDGWLGLFTGSLGGRPRSRSSTGEDRDR